MVTVAEATPRFCRMLKTWAWTFRQFAGRWRDAPLTVVFNDAGDLATSAWLTRHAGVEVHVRPRLSPKHKETNKFNGLWTPSLAASDWVLLTDADIAFADDLAPLERELTDADLAASPDGCDPSLRQPGRPSGWTPIRRFDLLLKEFAGIDDTALRALEHPWFIDRWPLTRYPYLNSGVIAIKSDRLPEVRQALVDTSLQLYARARRLHPNPVQLLRRFWNSRWDRTSRGERASLGWFFRQRFADQVAITVVAARLGLRLAVLPHAFNWRGTGMNHGDETPRILHYFRPAFGLPVERVLEPSWIPAYSRDANPGKRALARVIEAFLRAFPEEALTPEP